jgi:hypothetical protein
MERDPKSAGRPLGARLSSWERDETLDFFDMDGTHIDKVLVTPIWRDAPLAFKVAVGRSLSGLVSVKGGRRVVRTGTGWVNLRAR